MERLHSAQGANARIVPNPDVKHMWDPDVFKVAKQVDVITDVCVHKQTTTDCPT